jgi:hypothetical protein
MSEDDTHRCDRLAGTAPFESAAMQQPRLVPLPPPPPRPAGMVRVVGDQVVVEHLVLGDSAAAAFVASRPDEERVPLVERALRIGLLALHDAGVQVNVDVVRREFEALLSRTQQVNERAAAALDTVLRDNFADGEGRLPRTLERFLGNRGALQSFVEELFDEERRDSAIGRLRVLLGTYFDGDASRLAQLLDPTRLGSPLHQFRVEVAEGFVKLNDRLTAMESAAATRAVERQKQALKGADFEEVVADACGQAVRGFGDLLDRTGCEAGDVARSKKGDLVLTLDPSASRGQELRIVIECKDRSVSGREMREELSEAKRNRGACVGLVVFTPQHAPAGIAPFDVRGGDVYCVLDPAAPDIATMEAAVRLARLMALATLREHSSEIDADGIARALLAIREQLEQIRSLKVRLTSIGQISSEVSGGLDAMRSRVIAKVAEAEAALAAAGSRAADGVRT